MRIPILVLHRNNTILFYYCVSMLFTIGVISIYCAPAMAYHSSATVNLTQPVSSTNVTGKIKVVATFTITRPSLAWPIDGQSAGINHVSTKFGHRVHPVTGKTGFHRAIDIRASSSTNVEAIDNGTVISVDQGCQATKCKKKGAGGTNNLCNDGHSCNCGNCGNRVYGNNIWVQHNNGIRSHYSHLLSTSVNVNDAVSAGDKLGEVGSTGMSTGAHLDIEIKDALYLNPGDLLDATRARSYISSKVIKGLHHPEDQIRTTVKAFLDGVLVKGSKQTFEQGLIMKIPYSFWWTPAPNSGSHVLKVILSDVNTSIGQDEATVTLQCK